MAQPVFYEVDFHQVHKHNMSACGDSFLSTKLNGVENRIISVLADGLGSGIKANVLATLTATMATRFVSSNIPIERAARIIMDTLPICSVRKIGYSTFTIVDISPSGETRVMEHDNPPFILLRNGKSLPLERTGLSLSRPKEFAGDAHVYFSQFQAIPGDRIVFCSDGVTQSGIGTSTMPMGWGTDMVEHLLMEEVRRDPGISALRLARSVVGQALANDRFQPKDDVTCGVIHIRIPRRTVVFTGPPFNPAVDRELAAIARDFRGRRIVAGGTTARILARETNRALRMDMTDLREDVPPSSIMEGFDLVTEGTITLGHVCRILENKNLAAAALPHPGRDAATRMVAHLLDSDIVQFVVGTRINEALQEPNLPMELEIRRNVTRKIANILQEKYLKEVSVRFV